MVEINILKIGGLIVGKRGYIQIAPGVKDDIEHPPHLNHKKLVSNIFKIILIFQMFAELSITKKKALVLEGLILTVFDTLLNAVKQIVSSGLAKGFSAMETLVLKVKAIEVFEDKDGASVNLVFDKSFDGMSKNSDGAYVAGSVNNISFGRSNLTRQLCDKSDDVAIYRATRRNALGQKEFGVILFGAKLEMTRTLVKEGEVIPDQVDEDGKPVVADRDKYLTKIVKVELSEKAIREIDKATSL